MTSGRTVYWRADEWPLSVDLNSMIWVGATPALMSFSAT